MISEKPEDLQDDNLIQLTDELIERLRVGASIDEQTLLRQYPQYRTQLKEVIATLHLVAELGNPDPTDDDSSVHAPRSPDSKKPLGVLGDFRLLREIGRGGMGVVYEAEQLSLNRRVALKVLPFASVLDRRQLARFKNEAQAAAMLNHPHIVPVHGVGCERGVHYYAMQLIPGRTLAAFIEDFQNLRRQTRPDAHTSARKVTRSSGLDQCTITSEFNGQHESSQAEPVVASLRDTIRLSFATNSTKPTGLNNAAYFGSVVDLGIQAAKALQHAHDHGVVHRDIKPGNLMLDESGWLWITDFGLARIENHAGVTMSGDVVGTLRYMAPEQALAQGLIVDHRADVYSLGATLYELLLLEPAFSGASRRILLRQLALDEPKMLRRVNPSIPKELETIVHKAMAKDRDERYRTADELAEDLLAFKEHRPLQARPPSLAQRIHKWVYRHHAIASSAVLLLLTLTIGSSTATIMVSHEKTKTADALAECSAKYDEAEAARQRETAARQKAETMCRVALSVQKNSERQILRLTLKDVLPQVDQALHLDPMRYGLYAYRALIHLNLKNYRQAIQDSHTATRLNPDASFPYCIRAEAYHFEKKYDLAIAASDKALCLSPQNDWAIYFRASAYMGKKDYHRAAEGFRSGFHTTPTELMMLRQLDSEMENRASATTAQVLIAEAENTLGKHAALVATCQLAAWHLLANRKSEYEDVCRQVARKFAESKDPGILYIVSRTAAFSSEPVLDTKQLVAMATAALDAYWDPWAPHALGLCLLRDGQHDAAVERFRQSLVFTWNAPVNWLGLAIAHQHEGGVSQAQDWLRKAQAWCKQNPLDATSELHPYERIACQLLLREAEQLIEGKPASEED